MYNIKRAKLKYTKNETSKQKPIQKRIDFKMREPEQLKQLISGF